MALTEPETLELVHLLEKIEWPVNKQIFHALMTKIISVPMELAVIDDKNRIFTSYRQDTEYDGHHLPGTVLRDNETVPGAICRLLKSELADAKIESIKNIGWIEICRGNDFGKNPTRHEVSLLWLARIKNYIGKSGVFSPFDQLPKNILSHHRLIAEKVQEYLQTGIPILGIVR